MQPTGDSNLFRNVIMPTAGKSSFLVGLFLICMCCLTLQIIETRILSVVAYYYLAFFAIGMAMFGMTAGSLFVYFREQLFSDARLMQNLVWISSAFAITVVLSGFLVERADEVVRAYASAGASSVTELDGWAAVTVTV